MINDVIFKLYFRWEKLFSLAKQYLIPVAARSEWL